MEIKEGRCFTCRKKIPKGKGAYFYGEYLCQLCLVRVKPTISQRALITKKINIQNGDR